MKTNNKSRTEIENEEGRKFHITVSPMKTLKDKDDVIR